MHTDGGFARLQVGRVTRDSPRTARAMPLAHAATGPGAAPPKKANRNVPRNSAVMAAQNLTCRGGGIDKAGARIVRL